MLEITTVETNNAIDQIDQERLRQAGRAANHFAARNVFADHLQKITENSKTAIKRDLGVFCDYLCTVGVINDRDKVNASMIAFMNSAQAWTGTTWGLVKGFVQWQLTQGFAVSTINRSLSTVKKYCELAMTAGTLDPQEAAQIRTVRSIAQKEARNINQRRLQTRVDRPGAKKADSVLITDEHAKLLKTSQPNTAQGRKDKLLMCLLIDLGLRASEVEALRVEDVDMRNETINVYRIKTDLRQKLDLTRDLRMALRDYFEHDQFMKTGSLFIGGMSDRAITKRVQHLGIDYGYYTEELQEDKRHKLGQAIKKIGTLSAHDLRHYLATRLSRDGLNAQQLMETMGWASLSTAQRYIEASEIANRSAVALIDAK
jgi:integrase